MPRPVHFEIHSDDPNRAIGFYSTLFAWKFTKWDGPMEYWMVVTGPDSEPGINGGLMRRMGPPATSGQPVNGYVCTSMVPNLDESVMKAVSLGGTVSVPKMPILGMGWLAYVTDTEGNILGMMQSDPTAK